MRIALVVVGCGALMGCPSPNTYGTPRTTPRRKVAHTLAIEGIVSAGAKLRTYPMLPTYQLRVGLADRVDLGVRFANLDSLGLDVKFNFLKSTSIDLAVDPGVQAGYFGIPYSDKVGALYAHLPLLVGINLSDAVTVVGTPGIVLVTATSLNAVGVDSISRGTSALGRFGLGLNVRTSRKLALQPEVTTMRTFNGAGGTIIVFGLGFSFGAQPSYEPGSEDDEYGDDVQQKPAPVPTPSPPSPAGSSTPI